MKKLLLSAIAVSAIIPAATAQSHHGYFFKPSMSAIEGFTENDKANPADVALNCWFTPELIMPMEQADGSVLTSNIYDANKTDKLVRKSTMDNNISSLSGTTLSYDVKEDNFKNGYLEVTMPSKFDYPRASADEPQYVDATGNNNVMVFHLCLGSKPARINDADNTLSATGDEAMLNGTTGAYVGIKAPAGCTVKAFFSCSQISAANYKKDTSGSTWNENFHNTVSPAAFDFAETCDGTYKEMTSGAPYNCLAGMNYSTSSWPKGYCVKYVDIAVYGVKPGDVVGFGGIQTLHDGWTPQAFVSNSSVGEIIADEDAPVEYYNIQGMRVSENNLTNGIYVKRQGSKATKIVVK